MKLMALIQSLLILNIFVVQSGSMEPKIHTGSVVVSVKQNDYKQGDVISFYTDNSKKTVVTHRIVAELDNNILTSGDANNTVDSTKITKKDILGKVVFSVPYLGYFFNWVKNPYGLILFVLVPATIIIYEELKFIFSELKKKIKFNLKFKKSYLIVPAVPLFGSLVFFSNFSGAFFTDSKVSTNNTFATATSPPSQTALLYNSNEYTCNLGATNLDRQQLKNVIFTDLGSNVNIKVELQNATPNSTYDLWVNQDIGACPLSAPTVPDALTTDQNGNGTFSTDVAKFGGATKIWVSVVGGGQVLRSTSVNL